jgi:hypothetical protein
MPDIHLELSEADTELLETIRQQQGLDSLDQAAQWLIKQRLRSASLRLTGRNRAIYPVPTRDH